MITNEDKIYKYWCAPDYIDYGDQVAPNGDKLTSSKYWDEV